MRFPWRYLLVVATLMAGVLLLVACGGEEEEEAAGPTAATEEEAVEEDEQEEDGIERLLELGTIDLEDALLTEDDVPEGLTAASTVYYPEWSAEEQPFDACGTEMTFPDYSRSAMRNYDYQENGSVLTIVHGIAVFDLDDGDAETVVDLFREAAEECAEGTLTLNGSEFSVQTAPLSLPELGDETFAAEVAAEGEDFDWQWVIVIMRRGNIVNEVEFLAEPDAVSDELAETFARLADEKLERLGE